MSTRGQLSALRPLVENAGAGAYTLPAELLDAWRRSEAVKALKLDDVAVVDIETVAARVVASVADGGQPGLTEAAHELCRAEAAIEVHAHAQRVYTTAVEQAATAAANVAADMTERIIVDYLRPAHEALLDEVRRCASAVEGYGLDLRSLLGAPKSARDAYNALSALVARRNVIFEARRWASNVGDRRPEHDSGRFVEFENPHHLVPGYAVATSGRFPTSLGPDDAR